MTKRISIFISILSMLCFNISSAQYNSEFGSLNQCYGKTFSVVAWVLTDTTEDAKTTQGSLVNALAGASEKFADLCVDFKLCSYTELPNHRQDKLVRGIHDEEIAALYRKKNVINLYIASSISDNAPVPVAFGYTTLGALEAQPDTNLRDAIFLPKGQISARSLSHLLGAFFGLYPTHETNANGVELVDGSNCSTAGDLICDTPADEPGGSSGEVKNCQIIMDDQKQQAETSLTYEVPICNLMSTYTSSCDMHFTREQLNRMLLIMKTGRSYLW